MLSMYIYICGIPWVFYVSFLYSVLHRFSIYCTLDFQKEKIEERLANCQMQELTDRP
jgi:hypothetical protein